MKLGQKLAVNYLRAKFRILAGFSKKKAAQKALDLFRTPQNRVRNKLPGIFTESEKIQFDFEGFRLWGYQWNKGAGRKVLILHGFESSVINFDRYIKPLLRKNYEVMAFDAPGHGRSSGNMITAPLYASMIEEIQRIFGPVQSFLSHSFGCLALALALEKMRHDQEYRVAFIAPATETTTAADSIFYFLRLDEETPKEFDKQIFEMGGHPTQWYSIRRAMKNIKATILWVHDEDDDVTPLSDALKLKNENYSNIRFMITKGLGHSRIYRDNNVAREILDFL